MKDLQILYEDNSVIVVDKPAGLAVQGGKGVKSSLDRLLAELRSPAPLLVHRLDKDTSGVLLAAKTKEAAALFSRLLGTDTGSMAKGSKKAVKMYTAVCAGCPKDSEGIITQELVIHGCRKKAETRYKLIKSGKPSAAASETFEYSVLELELGTGRMHQIRRHLAMIGNPVLGDDKYGDFALNKKLRKTAGLKRLLLHASRLVIKDGYNLDICAPLPQWFSPWC